MTRILYVEDNEDNIYMLSGRLRRKGYEVSIAQDGEKGIAAALALRPALILMDLGLPVLDGWESSRRLKAMAETSAIPSSPSPPMRWPAIGNGLSPPAATISIQSRSISSACSARSTHCSLAAARHERAQAVADRLSHLGGETGEDASPAAPAHRTTPLPEWLSRLNWP